MGIIRQCWFCAEVASERGTIMINVTNPIRPSLDKHGALEAMKRAASDARDIAIRTNTYLIQVRDGTLVRVNPNDDSIIGPVTPDIGTE